VRRGGWRARLVALAALACAPLPSAWPLPKTDVVVLRNGDTLTGEVKEVDRGRLTFKTDDMGTLAIEWDKVRRVTASATFEVEDLDGHQFFGSLRPGAKEGEVDVVSPVGGWTLPLAHVVRVLRQGATFWQRLDGSVDAGVSYTSSSELLKLDFAGHVVLNRPGHEFSVDGNSTMTRQPDVEDTRRNSLTANYARRFPNHWVAFGQGQLEQNRELGFDVRGSVSAGGGRYLLHGRKQDALAVMGLRVNREKPIDEEAKTNTELALALTFDRFAYDFPKVDIYASLSGFASLSDWGRTRLELNLSIKRELLKDFTISIRGYESYDSRPPSTGVHNDYGVTFGLGWTF